MRSFVAARVCARRLLQRMCAVAVGVSGTEAQPAGAETECGKNGSVCRRCAMKQGIGSREQAVGTQMQVRTEIEATVGFAFES